MDSSRPRPPPSPIPAVPSNLGTASGSSAPAASSVSDNPGTGSTGQGVIHFMREILRDFRTNLWTKFYLNHWNVRDDAVHCPVGSGTPAKCTVSNLSDRDHEVQTIMFNPFCFGKPMLWHNEDATPHYKPLVAWSGRVQAEVTDKFSKREDADRVALANL